MMICCLSLFGCTPDTKKPALSLNDVVVIEEGDTVLFRRKEEVKPGLLDGEMKSLLKFCQDWQVAHEARIIVKGKSVRFTPAGGGHNQLQYLSISLWIEKRAAKPDLGFTVIEVEDRITFRGKDASKETIEAVSTAVHEWKTKNTRTAVLNEAVVSGNPFIISLQTKKFPSEATQRAPVPFDK